MEGLADSDRGHTGAGDSGQWIESQTGARGTLAEWRAWLLARGRSPTTVRRYEPSLLRLEASKGPLFDLDTDQIADWLGTIHQAPATVARAFSAVASYYGFLVLEGLRPDDPTTRLLRPRVPRGRVDQVGDNLSAKIGRVSEPFDAFAVAIVETGVLISELVQPDRIMVGDSRMVVVGRHDRERVVPLTPTGRWALLRIRGVDHLPSARTVQRRLSKEAGLTPRDLRHACAQRWRAEGWDLATIQDWLGHRSAGTTRGLYGPTETPLKKPRTG